MQIIGFSEVSEQQILHLAKIHLHSIPYSINAKMGVDHIKELYLTFLSQRDVFGFVALEEGKPCGLVLASTNYSHSANVTKPIRRKVVRKFLSTPLVFSNLFNILDFLSVKFFIVRHHPDCAYLMLWYVDKKWTGRGIGKELLDKINEDLALRSIPSIIVDVRSTSKSAIRGYIANGFEPLHKTFLSEILKRQSY